MEIKWCETDAYVFSTILLSHKPSLKPFGTFTNMEPSHLSHRCEIMTEWGFSWADAPLIKHVQHWRFGEEKETSEHEYYLAYFIGD